MSKSEQSKGLLKRSVSSRNPGAAGSSGGVGAIFGRPIEEVVESQLGRPLAEVTDAEKSLDLIPRVVRECVEWLNEHGSYRAEGLFRISGKQTLIDSMRDSYDHSGALDWSDPAIDTHAVSSLLKLYLRELPEPLFIFRYYSTFLKVSQNPDVMARLANVRKLLGGLPRLNRDTALYVLDFLSKVSQYEDTNKMGSSNLATIFAPNILRTEDEDPMQLMNDSTKVHNIVKLMIDEVDFMASRSQSPKTLEHDGGRAEMRSVAVEEAARLRLSGRVDPEILSGKTSTGASPLSADNGN